MRKEGFRFPFDGARVRRAAFRKHYGGIHAVVNRYIDTRVFCEVVYGGLNLVASYFFEVKRRHLV